MSESETPERTDIKIPFFFYDIIGRILPGSFLILGTIITFRGHTIFSWIAKKAEGEIKIETGVAALVLGVVVILFVGSSALVGMMLASVAHVILGWVWSRIHKLNFANMLKFLNTGDVPAFREHFERHFGNIDLEDPKQFKGASILCSYYVFCASQGLGTLAARHDAEALSAQSVVLASFILAMTTLTRLSHKDEVVFLHGWLVVLGSVFVGAVLTYDYHRKKKVYSRFGLYFASSEEEKVVTPTFE
jgi:hypothetical protein